MKQPTKFEIEVNGKSVEALRNELTIIAGPPESKVSLKKGISAKSIVYNFHVKLEQTEPFHPILVKQAQNLKLENNKEEVSEGLIIYLEQINDLKEEDIVLINSFLFPPLGVEKLVDYFLNKPTEGQPTIILFMSWEDYAWIFEIPSVRSFPQTELLKNKKTRPDFKV